MSAGRIGCALLAWPFVELVILLWAASTWGWLPVLSVIVLSFLIGLVIIRIGAQATGRSWSQALRTLQQRSMVVDPETGAVLAIESSGERPSSSAMATPAQTMLLIPAGMAIAAPGFVSTAVGAVLLLPGVRRRIAARWAAGLDPGRGASS